MEAFSDRDSAEAPDHELAVPAPPDRDDLRSLLRRVLRTDEAAPARLTSAGQGRMRVWLRTPFGALASRVLVGTVRSGDVVIGADHLLNELDLLPPGDREGAIDPGMQMRSAWSGLLPPAEGFEPVEIVPAQVLLDLAESGRHTASEQAGPLGLPPSLLDSVALTVGADTDSPVEVDMRVIFALDTAGFIPTRNGRAPDDEPVRVSTLGPWVRIDARFGTVHRRPESIDLGVIG